MSAQLAEPLRRYLGTEAAGAGLLLGATILALVWANSPWSAGYTAFWGTEVSLLVGGAELTLDLQHWVNDGLMVFFFFVIGLEVKREFVMGELTDRRRAAVPLVAAVTGLLVPALVFLAFNPSGEAAQAWGVVISTDTAFLLGVLALVGPACPTQLRLFLLTLAVADDVGALAIIAVFYTDDLSLPALGLAVAGVGLMIGLRYLRVWRGPAYFVVAVGVWVAMYESGVHPTIAGVLIALFFPAYPPRREEVADADRLARAFRQSPNPGYARSARLSIERSVSPNERLQQLYHPWSSFVIVPIFALANAGVVLDAATLQAAARSPLTLGIVAGLVAGKLFGILLGAGGAVRLRLGTLAPGLGALPLAGGAALSGIGFTISLFIVDLALDDPALADQARVGVLAASLLAALLGWGLFRLGDRLRGDGGPRRPVLLDPPVDPARDHVLGPADAPLTLVEYGDFECPFCGRATGAVTELRERLGDRLCYVFRHVPMIDSHPHAELAAEAAEAAGAQGRFWEMHDRLFAHQDALSAPDLLDHAAAVRLDLERFARELGDGRHAARVREDAASAEASGVAASPTFFIGGRRHTGPFDADTLAARLLAAAGEPPVPAATGPAPNGSDQPALGPRRSGTRGPELESADVPADAEETPDGSGAFPRLTAGQLDLLQRYGERRPVERGEVLFREGDPGYDLYALRSGRAAVVEDLGRATERTISVHGHGRFLGELNLLSGQAVYLAAVVVAPGEIVRVPADRLRPLFDAEPELRALILRAFLLRRSMLLGLAAELRIVGRGSDPQTVRLREFATRHDVAYSVTDLDSDDGAGALLDELGVHADELPVVVWRDGPVRRNPSDEELALVIHPPDEASP